MSWLAKTVLGDSTGRWVCCVSTPPDAKTPAIGQPAKLSRKACQRRLRELEEEKKKRDEDFAQKKAERAAMRSHLREKYQLRQNEKDTQRLKMVSGRVELPPELATIAKVGRRPENGQSLLGELPALPDINLTELGQTARATFSQLQQTTHRQCPLM
uniref:complexin-3-like n=1 Tax=Pristiophorus japonicus TaxID=55135 RepID=UPI00398F26F5